ncbi:hypothetical protein PHSY_003326 [Pseudozyma hubeiensis SY62]|uniref:Uncharacterized protein n=1 Tax=Pseudozyma hubeiensis (strain SY62) TaxID=1305764 RepID=R9PCF2_PSEHS|nr:hypothetical protein PHSY_003326 [Pseudozyma hubeiensis SY62]GAC95750.1 hypothetical protein PHSY_003326 [Pseudozyma hubeiensis SY62]
MQPRLVLSGETKLAARPGESNLRERGANVGFGCLRVRNRPNELQLLGLVFSASRCISHTTTLLRIRLFRTSNRNASRRLVSVQLGQRSLRFIVFHGFGRVVELPSLVGFAATSHRSRQRCCLPRSSTLDIDIVSIEGLS